MTPKKGESRGGEGGARSATTTNVVRLVALQLQDEEREPAEIQVMRITENMFAVKLTCHGEPVPEAFILNTADESWSEGGI